ncbi:MAG: hypothetical protein HUJ13_01605 [Hydrogenovibrio crunogenus]|nr:hypothetical protein [Hydrogenovibrio crunogenus]
MALQITVTDAGRAEMSAGGIQITEVGLGSGKYAADPAQTALQNETKRLSSISGLVISNDTIHITIKDDTADIYAVSELGLYTASGTLFAVYSDQANDFIEKLSGSTLMLAVDIKLSNIDVSNISFGSTDFANPPASETVSGVAKAATQSDTDTGTDDTKFITPKKLKAWVKQATESVFGLVKLSSSAQALAGTDTITAMPPVRVHEAFKQFGLGGGVVDESLTDLNNFPKGTIGIVTAPASNLTNTPSNLLPTSRCIVNTFGNNFYSTQELVQLLSGSIVKKWIRYAASTVWSPWYEITSSGQSLGQNGYRKHPDGLIEMWGKTAIINGDTELTITLPITFPNQIFGVTAMEITALNTESARSRLYWDQAASTLSQIVIGRDMDGTSGNAPVSFRVWGY